MATRNAQNQRLRNKRIQDHIKVLEFLMNDNNLKNHAIGPLESPQKMVIFFAGYVAMRRMWEVKTNCGRSLTGDAEIDIKKSDPSSIISRIDKEVAHPLGLQNPTLFRIATFKYWGKKFIKACTWRAE